MPFFLNNQFLDDWFFFENTNLFSLHLRFFDGWYQRYYNNFKVKEIGFHNQEWSLWITMEIGIYLKDYTNFEKTFKAFSTLWKHLIDSKKF